MEIVISGYYGFNNSGDEAILSSILTAFRQVCPDVKITVLSANPSVTEKDHSVFSIHRYKLIELFKVLWKSDLLVSGGGGLLQDTTSIRSPLYYLGVVLIARLMGKKVMYYAQGIGPLNSFMGKFLTGWVSNMVQLITVRDEKSKHILETLNVYRPPIYVTTDPVFAMSPASEEEILEIFAKEGISLEEGNYLGVCLRNWKTEIDYPHIISQVCDYMYKEFKHKIILIPMHYPQDLDFSKKVRGLIKSPSFLVNGNYYPRIIMSILGKMDCIIGMRLHSIIMASNMGIPSIPISYDPKVFHMSQQLGLEFINLEQITFDNLSELAFRVWNNRESISSGLIKKSEELKKLAIKNASFARELIQ